MDDAKVRELGKDMSPDDINKIIIEIMMHQHRDTLQDILQLTILTASQLPSSLEVMAAMAYLQNVENHPRILPAIPAFAIDFYTTTMGEFADAIDAGELTVDQVVNIGSRLIALAGQTQNETRALILQGVGSMLQNTTTQTLSVWNEALPLFFAGCEFVAQTYADSRKSFEENVRYIQNLQRSGQIPSHIKSEEELTVWLLRHKMQQQEQEQQPQREQEQQKNE